MSTDTKEKLHELLEEFDTAMLVTRTDSGELRARPMAVAQVEPDGTLWFMTQHASPKVEEIDHDDRVAVVMQSAMKFVSISGEATPVDDRQKVEELWHESWKT
jgi:general stress protein 26